MQECTSRRSTPRCWTLPRMYLSPMENRSDGVAVVTIPPTGLIVLNRNRRAVVVSPALQMSGRDPAEALTRCRLTQRMRWGSGLLQQTARARADSADQRLQL